MNIISTDTEDVFFSYHLFRYMGKTMRKGLLMTMKPLLCCLALTMFSGGAALAHHGWGHYDTATPLIFSGRVTEVRWSNPHPELVVRVESEAPSPAALPIPTELQTLGFDAVIAKAKPAPAGEWVLHLAPINRLQAWGLPRRPTKGDLLQGVGFASCTTPQAMRPSLVVIDNVPVRQQSVPLPAGCSGQPRG